ncbi:hypothetical protein CB1_000287017 [Camelus ferus]|nr:hypothetical protein CB1_000287017 [Camelus ferus]
MGPSRLRVSSGTEPPAFLDLSAFVPNSSEWPSSRDRPREQCWSAGLLALAGLVHEVDGQVPAQRGGVRGLCCTAPATSDVKADNFQSENGLGLWSAAGPPMVDVVSDHPQLHCTTAFQCDCGIRARFCLVLGAEGGQL